MAARRVQQERRVPCLKRTGQIGRRGEGGRVVQPVIAEDGENGIPEPRLFFRLFKKAAQGEIRKAQGLEFFRTVEAIVADLFRRGRRRDFVAVALFRNGVGAVEGSCLNNRREGGGALAEQLDGFLEQINIRHAPYVHVGGLP